MHSADFFTQTLPGTLSFRIFIRKAILFPDNTKLFDKICQIDI